MSASVDPSARRRIGTLIGRRYRLEQLIGVGGMGAVYAARAANDQAYAIKLLLNPTYVDDQELVARFVREGKVTAQLAAPNITKVFELSVDAKTRSPFIVMELLDGFDLQNLLGRLGPLHPQTAVRIAIQAARGLGVAHAAGIIHRDIKPGNLFLAHAQAESADPPSRRVQVKVCDFGIAKAVLADSSDAMTATGAMLGTPLYMSPEQIRSSKRVDPRTDVWSLGMTLYALLAGRPALVDVMSVTDLLVSITTKPVPWIQNFAPWIDPALARVVHGTLVRDLEPRCPSTEAFIEALLPFAGGSDALFEADLVPVPTALRYAVAATGVAGASWSESIAGDVATVQAKVDPNVQALLGEHLAAHYRLDRVLGVGGMGAVYESVAEDGTRVAVKVILGDADKQRPELLRRFVREARATMAIESPNVVRVVDVDTDAARGLPFIVMELLDGKDLDRLVKQHGALEPEPVVKAFIQACNGLAAAHAKSIVHRDIKPANLFLHELADGSVQVKVCDFGIAKDVSDGVDQSTELTRTGGMIGSPMYMSPEQARSAKRVGSATDIWSLGVALYESLSGRRPWEKCATVGDLIVAICTESVPPLADVAPWIDPKLALHVHRAMQRDPAARFATMEAFAEALAPFTGTNAPLRSEDLRPVRATRKASVAQREVVGSTTVPTSVPATTKRSARPPPPARRWIGPAALLGLAAVGAGAFAFASRGHLEGGVKPSEPSTSGAAVRLAAEPSVPAATTTIAPTKRYSIAVRIAPPTASVTVDGKPASTFADGVLTLQGEPGDRFVVVARVGDRTQTRDVFIDKSGRSTVDEISVATSVVRPIGGASAVVAGARPAPTPAAATSPGALGVASPSPETGKPSVPTTDEPKPAASTLPTKPVGATSF